MSTDEFRSILNQSFDKRHMDKTDIPSPFSDPSKILFLEWLIDQNYMIAEYRNDGKSDNETYYISTLGNAFLMMYHDSWRFRWLSMFEYYKMLLWIAFASAIGSVIANIITLVFTANNFL